jgi:outer membrane protein TolC
MTFLFAPKRLLQIGVTFLVSLVGAGLRAGTLPTPVVEDALPELKPILQQALAQSPQMILKNIEIMQYEGNYLLMRGQMLPALSVSASYSVNGAAIASNTNSSSNSSGLYYGAYLNQPLFRWGTLKAQTDAAKIQVSISQKNYAEAYRALAISLRSQYLALIVKKLALRNAQASHDQVATSLAAEEDKLRNGRIAENLVVNVRLAAEEAAVQAERTAEDLAQSKRAFLRMAGLKELSDDRIPAEIPAVEFDPAAANGMLRQFLGGRWEDNLNVQISRDWVKYYDANYKVQKYRLYPMFALGASLAQSNYTNAAGGTVTQTSVLTQYFGATMSWSIFDGLSTRGAKMSAMASKRYYERTLQNVSDQLLELATSQERQLGFAYRALKLAQARAGISETSLATIRDDARTGQASQASVEAALNVSYQTQLNVLNLRADFLSRWTEFVSTLGFDPALQNISASTHVQTR